MIYQIYQYASTFSDTIHIHLLWMRDGFVSFVNPREFPIKTVAVLRWEHSSRPADFMNAPVIYEVGTLLSIQNQICSPVKRYHHDNGIPILGERVRVNKQMTSLISLDDLTPNLMKANLRVYDSTLT